MVVVAVRKVTTAIVIAVAKVVAIAKVVEDLVLVAVSAGPLGRVVFGIPRIP